VTPDAGTDLISRLAAALTSLPQVEIAYLFGSHARGSQRAESDIDLGIQVAPRAAAESRATLALLFDRLGRVAPSDRLDLVLLNHAPSLLRHRILSTGRLLFERTPLARVRFATRTIRDYQDMQVRREFFYRKRLRRLREGGGADGGSGDILAQARRAAWLLGEDPGLPADE
jgi:predicted nucleotidyltransferase